jgi:ABC-type multidrug transport system fused ATPase/permease subunit
MDNKANVNAALIALGIVFFGTFYLFLIFTLLDSLLSNDSEWVLTDTGYILLVIFSVIVYMLIRQALSIAKSDDGTVAPAMRSRHILIGAYFFGAIFMFFIGATPNYENLNADRIRSLRNMRRDMDSYRSL